MHRAEDISFLIVNFHCFSGFMGLSRLKSRVDKRAEVHTITTFVKMGHESSSSL